MFKQLPTLGVGASLSLGADPDPISLSQQIAGPAFIEYAGLVNVDRLMAQLDPIQSASIPLLFHPSYINFCGSFANDDKWLETTQQHIERVQSPWFAQDCAYCFWQGSHSYASQLGYFIPPFLNAASLKLAITRVREVQAIVKVPVAIEPPPVTFIVGDMAPLEFFSQLANQTDCAMLLDMGHLVSYEMASFRSILDDVKHFETQRVIEIHIAGGKIQQAEQGPIYIDAHEHDIQESVWHMFEKMLTVLPNVKAVCYECEGVQQDKVLTTLDKIRGLILAHSISPDLVRKVEQERGLS